VKSIRAINRLLSRNESQAQPANADFGLIEQHAKLVAIGNMLPHLLQAPRLADQATGSQAPGARQPHLTEYKVLNSDGPALYLLLADLSGAVMAACAVFHVMVGPRTHAPAWLPIALAGFVLAWMVGAYLQRLYDAKTLFGGLRRQLPRALTTCAIACGLLLFAGFGLNAMAGVGRAPLLLWIASVCAWVGMTRLAWRAYMRRELAAGTRMERVLVLAGSEGVAHRLGRDLEYESGGTIGVAAWAALPGLPDAPPLGWVDAVARGGLVDRVVMGVHAGVTQQVNAVVARLARVAVDVTVMPDLDGLQAPALKMNAIGTLPSIDLVCRPLTRLQLRTKRAEDLVLGGLATIFVLPVLVAIAIAIKLDSPGPVLFRQKRAGLNDQIFQVMKFRTMYAHARDDLALRQTSRGDARVTRVGRFLRRTSLDELPQLLNVLIGDMSLVGPRPHPLGMTSVGVPLHEVTEEYPARHRLKPGITGWAQISGNRGEVDSHEKLRRRVALDCYYIETWSLGLDLWIMLRTALVLFADPNAY
jgi:Undecaprenyl-phosphate glucose phosphotransferase